MLFANASCSISEQGVGANSSVKCIYKHSCTLRPIIFHLLCVRIDCFKVYHFDTCMHCISNDFPLLRNNLVQAPSSIQIPMGMSERTPAITVMTWFYLVNLCILSLSRSALRLTAAVLILSVKLILLSSQADTNIIS